MDLMIGLGGSVGVMLLTTGSELQQRIHDARKEYLTLTNSSLTGAATTSDE